MNGNQIYFIGIIVGGLIMMVWMLMHRGQKKEYDERQMIARGTASKYGFATLVGYNLIYGGVYMQESPEWCDNFIGILIGVVLSLAVFCGCCIWNDAYMNLNQSIGKVYLMFGCLGGANLLLGIMSLWRGNMIEYGKISFRVLNLFFGIIFLLFLCIFWMKNHSGREEE